MPGQGVVSLGELHWGAAVVLWKGVCCNYGLCAGICSKVCSCVAFPDVITCLKFLQFPCSSDLELGAALQLAVGTAQGSVWVLDAAMNSTAPAKPLNARYCAPYQLECG